MKEIGEEMVSKAWKMAIVASETNRPNLAMEWTGIAKTLEELSGKRDWGIFKRLESEEV